MRRTALGVTSAALVATALLTTVTTTASAASFDPKEALSQTTQNSLTIHTVQAPLNGHPQPEVTGSLGGENVTHTMEASNGGNEVWNNFKTEYTVANLGTFVRINKGQSISEWMLGEPTSNPRVAAGEMETKIWATGLGISVSVPAGATGSIFEQTVTYKATVPNNYVIIDNYGGAEFSGPLLTINQNVTGSWTEGSTTYRWTTN